MRMMRKICVAVKDARSEVEVEAAKKLAAEDLAQVRALHVWLWEGFGRARFAVERPDEATFVADASVFELRMAGVGAHGVVRRAPVDAIAQAIVDDAAAWGADLIIVGPSHRKGLARWVNRGTAHRVTQLASCPVVVATAPAGGHAKRVAVVEDVFRQ